MVNIRKRGYQTTVTDGTARVPEKRRKQRGMYIANQSKQYVFSSFLYRSSRSIEKDSGISSEFLITYHMEVFINQKIMVYQWCRTTLFSV